MFCFVLNTNANVSNLKASLNSAPESKNLQEQNPEMGFGSCQSSQALNKETIFTKAKALPITPKQFTCQMTL